MICREVFQYPLGSDSTLGKKTVKREHSPEEAEGEASSSKKIKLEDGSNQVSSYCK